MLPFECEGTEMVTPYLANNVNATDTSFVAVSGWPKRRIVICRNNEKWKDSIEGPFVARYIIAFFLPSSDPQWAA